jgi:U11/U12 small nuclear ribonucleoprotein 65 kDa protein
LPDHAYTFLLQEDVDKRKSKRAKHEAIVGPAVDKSVAHEAVGVKPASLVSSELQVIKKKNPILQVDSSSF